MTSKERIRRAVKFQGPDRVPVDLPEPYGSDFLHVGPDPHPDWRPSVGRTNGDAYGRSSRGTRRWGRSSSTPSRFGGRLCFWCPVDIQHTMVHGTPEEVAQYARRLIDAFGRFRGGFIAKWYPSPEAVGHSWDKIRSMSEAFLEYGGRIYSEGATC